MALRGDPQSGPRGVWQENIDGFNHADQLVELAIQTGDFKVGVAAFPDGHPASNFDFEKDVDVLIRKEELGATFATTQFFFEVSKWQKLVDRLAKRGSTLPIIAGVLPITNLKQLNRMSELSGTQVPDEILKHFEGKEDNPEEYMKILRDNIKDFKIPESPVYDEDDRKSDEELKILITEVTKEMDEYKLGKVELFTIPTEDGYDLPAKWFLPFNFDESKKSCR